MCVSLEICTVIATVLSCIDIFPLESSRGWGTFGRGSVAQWKSVGPMVCACYAKLPFRILHPVGSITGSRARFSSGTPKIVNATDRSDNCVLPWGFLAGYNCVVWPFL